MALLLGYAHHDRHPDIQQLDSVGQRQQADQHVQPQHAR
jgi:hypothetical protein